MISYIYAHRNRDTERIKISFESLRKQKLQNFQVIFVDYGSETRLVKELEKLCNEYNFVKFFHLPVQQLLWNKSKALNYGIVKADGEYIFIADVDLVFHPETVSLLKQYANPKKFQLFNLGYLNKEESKKLETGFKFNNLNPARFGEVNGMIFTSKESLLKINGFDEFFHFYGAEDEDLFNRMKNAGYKEEKKQENYFYHNWHPSFQGSEDNIVTLNPRVKNIMRINQQHFFRNKKLKLITPLRQNGLGNVINEEEKIKLNSPTKTYKILNIAAQVEHFLNEELPWLKNEIVEVKFTIDPFYNTLKYKVKQKLGKHTQPYYSLKQVNDLLLKKILFDYRNHNYSFKISEDLNSILFSIKV